jgi:hypothetical protein
MNTDAGSADAGAVTGRAKLSAYVIAYNRAETIGTCLRALAFADELIVIDKGSTDATVAIAAALADRVIRVPWTPTVEETRDFAASQCTHDWILFVDDDECLSVEAVRFLDAELWAPRADIYMLAQRHYIMGRHDERAYYWPEYQMRCFRRGAVRFTGTVHGGTQLVSDRVYRVRPEAGACMHHLSHRDVAQFIEKANRYTSQPDRRRSVQTGSGLAVFAHGRIDHWLALTDASEPDSYPVAVAVLRSVYDLIDRLKNWEEEAGLDGAALFGAECARLDAAYATGLTDIARPRAHAGATSIAAAAAAPAKATTDTAVLSRAVQALRDSVAAHRGEMDAVRADLAATRQREDHERRRATELEATLSAFARQHDAMVAAHQADIAAREAERVARIAQHEAAMAGLREALSQAMSRADAAEHRARAIEASTSWRITAPVRAALVRIGRR